MDVPSVLALLRQIKADATRLEMALSEDQQLRLNAGFTDCPPSSNFEVIYAELQNYGNVSPVHSGKLLGKCSH
jgi:hypothetical protein